MNSSFSFQTNSILACANEVLKKKGRSFHWARRLLNTQHAARATRLYHLCRYLDDLADEATCVEQSKTILNEIKCSIQSGHSTNPIICDGLLLIDECKINPQFLSELIDGVASDLHRVAIADMDELLRYCYQVAGTVGLMMCSVLDVKDPKALPHAVDLGIAMQLTNICRDVRDDALAGRRYLPATMLGDMATNELVEPSVEIQPQLQQCLRTLLEISESYYCSGELGLSYLPLGARAGILTAARLYRAIGTGIKNYHHRYWQGRVVVTPMEKAALTARALLSVSVVRSFWQPTEQHDSSLHLPLAPFNFVTHIKNELHGV